MLKHATLITVIGFLLIFVGIVSLFLNLVGVDLFFMSWLYRLGPTISFGLRLLFVALGFVLIFVGRTDWDREDI